MSSKRTPPQDSNGSGTSQPQPKRQRMQFEPVRLGQVSTLEEMDIKILQFQNKKLGERLEQRQRAEADLRLRIEQLEKRQTQDDAVLCVVNRYWNQLNEDIRILLQRFDAETSDESENRNENEATTSFLTQLSTWDKQELEEKLAQRVHVSQRAVAKIVQAFDRLVQRNEKISMALKGVGMENEDDPPPNLNEVVRETNVQLQAESHSLHCLVTSLHEKHHVISLKLSELQDKVTALETVNAELNNRVEDLEYDLTKTRQREEKLDRNLCEALEKLKAMQSAGSESGENKNAASANQLPGMAVRKVEDLTRELEEQKELANNRLVELEKLHQEHKSALKDIERLKMDLQQLPESVIVETTEYKCLQSQFSVLYNESMQLKNQLEESRNVLQTSKNNHLRHIEQMESEELGAQKKIRTEVIQLEDTLAQVRKEYEMLRIEFEQNLAANEQTGPINREMRHLITSLQNHNQQLKGEVARYKRRLKEAMSEIGKLKAEGVAAAAAAARSTNSSSGTSGGGGIGSTASGSSHRSAEETTVKDEPTSSTGSSSGSVCPSQILIKEELIKREREDDKDDERDKGKSDADIIRDLKAQLKKSQEAQREMKLLLDMYKGVAKEQRDKVQLMAAEKKAKMEIEEFKQQLKKVQESEKKDRRKLADDDAMRKIKQHEETIQQLQRGLAAQKQVKAQTRFLRQEEEALLNEMEVTGQAFEDMQEQNIRLIQQLREKDDANFKLMSERIKSNQIHKLLREEKDMLSEQVTTLHTQVEAQNQVVRKLEEKERILQNNLSTVEKELSLRQQAMEMHKRKAIESAQSAADLKLHLEKYHSQLKEAQGSVADKSSALEHESFKTKRLQEDIGGLRRKVERAKKFELATTADEVLMEEIREYKEQLTCPSCKVKRKDAVLTKCFHVFCFDCLKTRYETRQRKCPKCNAAFGANDFHRLYLS